MKTGENDGLGGKVLQLLSSATIRLNGSLVHPHLEYGMSACSQNLVIGINHLERIKRLATRLLTDIRPLPYEERLRRRRLQAGILYDDSR